MGLLPACQESSNPSSAIKGKLYFSVSDDKKIIFSSGNLQYQPSTGSWRFADNQWDIFIPDNSNDSIGQWIAHFANDTSMLNNSVGDGWRLLTQDEWLYLTNIRENASNLISMATVQGKHGMVILPDNFDSTGIRFTPAVPVDYSFRYKADNYDYNADMTTNIYDAEEWKKMEEAGAVFFPCAGLAVNIPDSISIESEEPCYTKSIFGVVAQIPEIYKDSIETDKEEEWLYLDILFSPYTRRHFSRQINAENPSNIGYCGMGAGEYWISDKRSRDTTSFPIIHFYVENNEGRGTIESKTRYDGCDLLPVRLVKDAECSK
ncbi:MAG: hypothetical protein J6R41_07580 [Paludibacteraceae bacterium]|nr:hypothetical protein [Paludibacteraceae bacterium]